MIVKTHYEVGQTALTVICEEQYLGVIKEAVCDARFAIESKIAEDPFFGVTYDPYPPSSADHPLVVRMCQASVKAGVGPMAGVAGAVASYAAEKAVDAGCGHVIIENGGDIALRISEDISIGIFADDEKFRDLALSVHPSPGIRGICSSSGTVGPSVSFGRSGICTVLSDDVVLADCCATAFGNMIRDGTPEEMSSAAERTFSIDGVDGCICVCGGLISMCGEIPELVKGRFDDCQLTGVRFSHA